MNLKVVGRQGKRIQTIEEWRQHGGPASVTHWKPGRSAYELAAEWIERQGEDRLLSLIELAEGLEEIRLVDGVAEKKTYFDGHPGPRNHDLLVRASAAVGPVTIGIEAKADEPFDLPLWRYREEGLRSNPNTGKLDRIDHLVSLWFARSLAKDRDYPPLVTTGYQLFSALAGTLADAKLDESAFAVLVVYEFITDLTDDANHVHNARVYEDFLLRLVGPDQERRTTSDGTGWLTRPFPIRGDGVKLPLQTHVAFGKVSRNLRTGPQPEPASARRPGQAD
jgi:hypothetical protein